MTGLPRNFQDQFPWLFNGASMKKFQNPRTRIVTKFLSSRVVAPLLKAMLDLYVEFRDFRMLKLQIPRFLHDRCQFWSKLYDYSQNSRFQGNPEWINHISNPHLLKISSYLGGRYPGWILVLCFSQNCAKETTKVLKQYIGVGYILLVIAFKRGQGRNRF